MQMEELRFYYAQNSGNVDVIIIATGLMQAWEYLVKIKSSDFKKENLDHLDLTQKIEYLQDEYVIYVQERIMPGAYLRMSDGAERFEYIKTLGRLSR
jgi:hypothetical protein